MGYKRQLISRIRCQTNLVITLACLFQISGSVLSNDTINLRCNYEYDYFYRCTLYNLKITTKVLVTSISGSHSPGKSYADVKEIQFYNGTMFLLPTGIGHFFENLILLKVGHMINPLALGTIQRPNFQSMNKLKYLWIHSNNKEMNIGVDAFWHLPNLTSVFIHGNSESLILHENTFRENKLLRDVSITNVHIEALPGSLFRRNLLLYSVDFQNCSIKTIDENLFETNTQLNWVDLSYNKIEHLPRNLFSNTAELFAVILTANNLKTIDVDFTQMYLLVDVRLKENTCIDAEYWGRTSFSVISLGNITEFQNLIKENCSEPTTSFTYIDDDGL